MNGARSGGWRTAATWLDTRLVDAILANDVHGVERIVSDNSGVSRRFFVQELTGRHYDAMLTIISRHFFVDTLDEASLVHLALVSANDVVAVQVLRALLRHAGAVECSVHPLALALLLGESRRLRFDELLHHYGAEHCAKQLARVFIHTRPWHTIAEPGRAEAAVAQQIAQCIGDMCFFEYAYRMSSTATVLIALLALLDAELGRAPDGDSVRRVVWLGLTLLNGRHDAVTVCDVYARIPFVRRGPVPQDMSSDAKPRFLACMLGNDLIAAVKHTPVAPPRRTYAWQLPDELTVRILARLDSVSLVRAAAVSTHMRVCCMDRAPACHIASHHLFIRAADTLNETHSFQARTVAPLRRDTDWDEVRAYVRHLDAARRWRLVVALARDARQRVAQ